jgi:Protein of unknown function (DUF3313)
MRTGLVDLLKLVCANLAVASLAACASAPLSTSGSLASYDSLRPAKGFLNHTDAKLRVDKEDILAAKSVTIVPTSFSDEASKADLTDQQRHVIANEVDRSICNGLSDRFEIVSPGQPADLTVHATITHVTVTDPTTAGASKVASLVPTFVNVGFPVVVPRIPVGMGSLSVEAEARDAHGQQKAALVWARGADALTSSPRVSASGDPYDLAGNFAADFNKLLITGENPFNNRVLLPSAQRLKSSLGGKPLYPACDAFGRSGIMDFIGGRVGAPPELTDKATPVAQ